MAAPRHYKNRRKNDPMNFRVGPKCCVCSGSAVDSGVSPVTELTFNAAVELTVANISAWNLNGDAPVSVEKVTANIWQVTWPNPVTAGDILFAELMSGFPAGPNITNIESSVRIG